MLRAAQSAQMIPWQKLANERLSVANTLARICSQFVALCRGLGLFADAAVAIDGSKFKAVNNRDRNFTRNKMKRRMEQIEESVERYLHQLDSADRQEPSLARTTKTVRLHLLLPDQEPRKPSTIIVKLLRTCERQQVQAYLLARCA